jgi:hypothetical protein
VAGWAGGRLAVLSWLVAGQGLGRATMWLTDDVADHRRVGGDGRGRGGQRVDLVVAIRDVGGSSAHEATVRQVNSAGANIVHMGKGDIQTPGQPR